MTGVEPATAVVSLVTPEDMSSIRSAFCNQVHFFASPEEANPWLETHPGGTVLPVVQAYGLAASMAEKMLVQTQPQPGTFAIASFWLVEALALAGRAGEAEKLFAGLAAPGGELGSLAEEIDPATGAQLGNTPQAFTHIGLINAALRMARTSAKDQPASRTPASTRARTTGGASTRLQPAAAR